jgi:hypothetical protein
MVTYSGFLFQVQLKSIMEKCTFQSKWLEERDSRGNFSGESCSGIDNVFRAMFPTPGAVPEDFTLNPTKCLYLITDALYSYFREQVLEDARNSWYTLQYDETTNAAGHKELQTVIRFWSESRSSVVVHHLETFYMGHATAENIKGKVLLALSNADLPLSNIIMVGSDGPNVNKKVLRLINEEVKSVRGKGLVNIGTCNIHVIHNAFQRGLEELGTDSSDLVVFMYNFFDGWPARWEDYSKVQNQKKVSCHSFIKHVSNRWLTLQPALQRLLEQWEVVREYFLNYIPSKCDRLMNTSSYSKIVSLLRKPSMKAELRFVICSTSLVLRFNFSTRRTFNPCTL